MRLPTLPLLLLSACAAPCGGPQPAADDDRSVIERRLARAETAGVQAHVTAETVSTDAAPRPTTPTGRRPGGPGLPRRGRGGHRRPRGTDVHRAEASSEGLNAFTMGARPGAVLVDMAGAEVHRWDFAITDAWPGLDHPEMIPEKIPWRRIQVLENGDLIGIWSGYGLARITADARLIWGHWLPVHHDLHVYPDGRVVTLTAHPVDRPALSAEPVIDDRLTWLSADGYPERSVSVLDALMAHPDWDRLWAGRTDRDTNDVLHTNTVFVLEEDHADAHPAFTAGRVLVSMRALSALALIDPTSGEAVWVHTGPYVRQHDPQVTADGKLWVFDNQGAGKKRSRMLRYDLATNEIEADGHPQPPLLHPHLRARPAPAGGQPARDLQRAGGGLRGHAGGGGGLELPRAPGAGREPRGQARAALLRLPAAARQLGARLDRRRRSGVIPGDPQRTNR